MKGCIGHFVKWYIHPFISRGTRYSRVYMLEIIIFKFKVEVRQFIKRQPEQYVVGFKLVVMGISTNLKPTIYRNLYEKTGPDRQTEYLIEVSLEFIWDMH